MKSPTSARLAAALWGAALMTAASARATTLMDADWADRLCAAWNADATLTGQLAGDAWAGNNAGRGYKVIHLYREACGPGSAVELVIADRDGKAICASGGAVTHPKLDKGVDYLMHATDEDWACMGAGKFGCGAMGAMMSGKLKFSGPKGEAMAVMGPFESFLKLTGKVPGETTACP